LKDDEVRSLIRERISNRDVECDAQTKCVGLRLIRHFSISDGNDVRVSVLTSVCGHILSLRLLYPSCRLVPRGLGSELKR
jgi:hypothetical protein